MVGEGVYIDIVDVMIIYYYCIIIGIFGGFLSFILLIFMLLKNKFIFSF